MKDNEKVLDSEKKTENPESESENKVNDPLDTSIEQIDDSELPQSLKDKFKVC